MEAARRTFTVKFVLCLKSCQCKKRFKNLQILKGFRCVSNGCWTLFPLLRVLLLRDLVGEMLNLKQRGKFKSHFIARTKVLTCSSYAKGTNNNNMV